MEASAAHEERVTPLELFFDLVFVFAMTQVTSMLSAHPTWRGLVESMLVLGAIWWAWVAYAWLTNTLNPEEGKVRIAMFGSMGAMLVVSLTVPEAFDEHGVVFGVAYLVVRVMHLVLYSIAARGDPHLRGAVLRLTPTVVAASAMIIVAGFMDGADQLALWIGALVIDYAGPLLGRGRGWRLHPRHFAERHALVVIIALGESIVALGVGARALDVDLGVIVAALLGFIVVAALWWTYFDWVAIVVEDRLRRAESVGQSTLARDAYSYFHFPMVAGIVLFAVGLKKTLERFGEPLEAVPATALCAGLAVYFAGHVLVRYRLSRTIGRGRPVALVALAASVPIALAASAIWALAWVTAVCVALVAYEALRYREMRARIRGGGVVPSDEELATSAAR